MYHHTRDTRARARFETLKGLLESPFKYTKQVWIKRFNEGKSTTKNDLTKIRNAGFEVETGRIRRHGIILNKVSENLKKNGYFTESEFSIPKQQLDTSDLLPNQKALLSGKPENIFDLTKIGGAVYNNAFLQKLNILIQTEEDKQKVRFKNYYSVNTNSISDRVPLLELK
jgi:hypothetical protein